MKDSERIQYTEETYRRLLSVLGAHQIGVWEYDFGTAKMSFSDDYFRVLNFEQEGILFSDMKEFSAFLHPEDRVSYFEAFDSFLKRDKDSFNIKFRCIGKSGKVLYYEDCLVCHKETENRIVAYTMNLTDAEENRLRLKQQEERNHRIIEALPDLIFIFNRDFFFEDVLLADKVELLHEKDYLIGNDARNIFSPEVSELYMVNIAACLDRKELREIEYHLDVEGYTRRYFQARMVPFGENRVLTIVRGVTDKVLRTQQIQEMNTRLSFIIQAGDIHPWTYSVGNNVFKYWPDGDASSQECLLEDFVELVYPDDREVFLSCLEQLVDGVVSQIDMEFRLINRNGEYIWHELQGAVFRLVNKKPEELIGHIINRHKRKLIEQELIGARKRAEEADRMKSTFLANMSHEIRTPLNAIVGFSDIVSSVEDSKLKEEYMEIIHTNSDLLIQLINDILDLSRIESGKMDFHIQRVNLNELLEEVIRLHRLKINKEVELKLDCPQEKTVVETDRNRIMQVIFNFMSNAIKNTKKGSITLGMSVGEDSVCIFVTDTGCGISEEKLPSIFGRFVKINDFVQGTGLGLAICKTIVEKLRGEIKVQSEYGKGSTFSFTLPYRKETDKEVLELVRGREDSSEDEIAEGIGKTILIAEDVVANYLLANAILRKDYTVVWAMNGKEAVDRFLSDVPDLILMDIKMPVMDGIEAVRNIRLKSADIPVIAVTAHAFCEEREAAVKAGCDDVLLKPYTAEELKGIVRKYIR